MTRRAMVLALLLAGCSKRCGQQHAIEDAIVSTVAETSVSVDITDAGDATTPSAVVSERLEMPDACLDVATDLDWRIKIWCHADQDCNESAIDSGVVERWDVKSKDLNGDGEPEMIRGFSMPHGDNEELHVYLGGARPCAVHVTTMSASFDVLATRHDGWADISSTDGQSFCEGVFGCGCKPSVTFYVHKNDGYEEDKSRKIEGKVGHCPQPGEECSKTSECSQAGLVCVDGKCAFKP